MNTNYNPNQKFGKHLQDLFLLDPKYINLNNGSFGTPPKKIIQKQRQIQEYFESCPDRFVRYEMTDRLKESREVIGKYVNADPENIVLMENSSEGVNCVFRSLLTQKGEKLLMFDCGYFAAKNCAKYLITKLGIEMVEMKFDEELINSDTKVILDKIENILITQGPFKLACIDHITFLPAMIMPVKEIIQILKKHNVISFIDGAHTVGQLTLDISDLNPDIYVSSFHKWGYCSKAVCFLFAHPDIQNKLVPTIISVFYGLGFTRDFGYAGNRDYSPWFTIKDALEFRSEFGEEEIMNYMRGLSWEGGNEVAKIWNTELLIKDKERTCAMVNVRIPCTIDKLIEDAAKKTLMDFNTFVVTFKFNNIWYARLSAQIYNDVSDFVYAATNFLNVLNELELSQLKI